MFSTLIITSLAIIYEKEAIVLILKDKTIEVTGC